jgi:hypothetical protein
MADLSLRWTGSIVATSQMLAAATNVVNNIGGGPSYLAEKFARRFPQSNTACLPPLAGRLYELTNTLDPNGMAAFWRGSTGPRSLD